MKNGLPLALLSVGALAVAGIASRRGSASLPAKIFYNKDEGDLVVPEGYAVRLTKIGKMSSQPDRVQRLIELVPERATHRFALHPKKWVSTYTSLTGKDRHKVVRYAPIPILITPGTLVGEMRFANRYLWDGNEEDALRYRDSIRPLHQIDISEYALPELLVPPEGSSAMNPYLPLRRRGSRATVGAACPPATQDIALNTTNRDRAIQMFDYGPPNPAQPSNWFWKKIASRWSKNPSAEQIAETKTMRCGNCGVFDVSPAMKACMPRSYAPDAYEAAAMASGAVLGYCWAHNFKCASTRTCATWVQGPAISSNARSPMNKA